VDEAMHVAVVLIKLRPESVHISFVVPPSRFRVVPIQGIGDKIGSLEGSRRSGISEHWHISKIPQLA
jgi:hypothetical protein